MPLIESESLILKTYNLAEADRIVVFLTREHGVVRGVAKGAKRLKSRFGSTLELFSSVNLTYFQKEDRELVSIQNAELDRSFFAEAVDPEFLSTFSYVADLLLQFVPPADPNETLYRMLKACLSAASEDSDSLPALRLYFELWLLRLGGYLPIWDRCENCKTPFATKDMTYLRSDFHLHCPACRKAGGSIEVEPEYRDLFTQVQKLAPGAFVEYVNGREEATEAVSGILRRVISQVLCREVSGQRSVERMVRKNAV